MTRRNSCSEWSIILASLLTITFAFPASSWGAPVVSADTNRDGTVDFEDDLIRRDTWTAARGAIFLVNNDSDDNSRVPDWDDDVVNGNADLLDMAVVRVAAIPELAADARLTMTVDNTSAPLVRLFLRDAQGNYAMVTPGVAGNLPTELARNEGIELRLEAKSYATPTWDGRCTITVTLRNSDGTETTDAVQLRVAPFLMLAGTQRATIIYARDYPTRNEAFMESLRTLVPQAGATFQVVPADAPYPAYNIWLQDTMEVGYHAMPGHSMPVVLRANRNKPLDNYSRDVMMSPDFGWIQWGRYRAAFGAGDGGDSWLDWYGNLEATPPIPGYPLGRVFYGVSGANSLNPEVVAMINAQEVQGPALGLDVGWLLIKHVDEMVSFIPSGVESEEFPIRVIVPDTTLAIGILEQLAQQGKGSTRIFPRFEQNMTVASLLADQSRINYNRTLQANRINPMIQKIIAEFKLPESAYIRVPALYNLDGSSLMPNLVNSLVLNGIFVAPMPDGPVVDGKDVFEEDLRQRLSAYPVEVHFIDDWRYHTWSGNVHCGTNATREPYAMSWWDALGARQSSSNGVGLY